MNRITKETVRLTSLCGRLPDIGTVVVLQLTDSRNILVIHNERSILAVRTLKGIYQVDDVICLDGRSKSLCNLTATGCSEQTERLAHTVTV